MILVEQLSHILLYIHVSLTDASTVHYVAQLPNAHGHAIFKKYKICKLHLLPIKVIITCNDRKSDRLPDLL
jgi:hypothetical protein